MFKGNDYKLHIITSLIILMLLFFMGLGGMIAECTAIEIQTLTANPIESLDTKDSFVGSVNNKVVFAGGIRSSSDSKSPVVYSDAVSLFEKKQDGSYHWMSSTIKLPVPTACGTGVSSGNSFYMIGGITSSGPTADCYQLLWDKQTSQLRLVSLPKLPKPLLFPSVAVMDKTLYVLGGFTDVKCETPSDGFYTLNLGQTASSSSWQTLTALPMGARANAPVAIQNNEEKRVLYLFGGQSRNKAGQLVSQNDAWFYTPSKKTWTPVLVNDRQPFSARVTSAWASGTTHILFFGLVPERENVAGQMKDENAESTQAIYAYNTITKRFFLFDQTDVNIPESVVPVQWNGAIALLDRTDGTTATTPEILFVRLYPQKNNLGLLNIIVMTFYFGLLAWMGYYFARRQKGTEDYFRGGQRVPWWIVGISIFGTTMSAISYMAVPAKAYMTNWSYIILALAPVLFSPFIIYFLIPNLRKYNLTSAYEYLEYRFNVLIRTLGSIIFICFQVVRMAVMLFLPAIALNVVANIDIYMCIGVVGVVSLIYTMFGGIEAVIWTDVLQVVILMGGLIVALAVIFFNLDTNLMDSARIAMADHKTYLGSLALNFKEPTVWTILVSAFFLFVVPFSSDQSLVQRYFVSKTDKEAGSGLWVNAWITFPGSILLFVLGTAFYVFYKANPTELSVAMGNNDSLLPWFVITQLPQGVSGLLIVAIFAASMSSLSASMNAISAAYTIDFHERLFRCSHESSLTTAKLVTLISGSFGILLAMAMVTWDISSFWDEYNRLLGLLTSGLAGLFFLGILSKRANAGGALIGLVVSIIVQMYVIEHKSIYSLLYSGTGFVSCIVAGILGSYLFPPPVINVPVKEEYQTSINE